MARSPYHGPERRSAVRREQRLPVEIEVIVNGRPQFVGEGTTLNISPAGALIKTSAYLAVGALLRLRIKGVRKTVQTLGRISRVTSTRDRNLLIAVNFAHRRTAGS